MPKKRKAAEISEDEKLQVVIVRDPYGWNDPSTWASEDRSRRDNGLYVCVEWLEYIFGDLGAPGSLSKQRKLGPAVQEIWHWAARNELLVSIRTDIDTSPQLGRHVHAEFLKEPPRNSHKFSLIMRSKHQSEEQIMRGGEGWKSIPNIPMVQVSSIRRQNFVSPYPSPNMKAIMPSVELDSDEGVRDHKPRMDEDSKRVVKMEVKQESTTSVDKPDIKPNLVSVKQERSIEGEIAPTSDQIKGVKTEDRDSNLTGGRVKPEEESLESVLARGRARLAAIANEDTTENLDSILARGRARLATIANEDISASDSSRPNKRVKAEQE